MNDPIAIVGTGCVLPGAPDSQTFWKQLRGGSRSLVPVPPEAWDHRLFHSEDRQAPDRTHARLGGFVTDFVFDWRRFRVPPADAAAVNPMQWMVLEAGAQALSGITSIPRETTAIILGSTGLGWQPDSSFRIRMDDMLDAVRESPAFAALPAALRAEALERTAQSIRERLKEVSEDNVVGASASVAAGRINMHFDLRGPHYSVDAGFASSLAAVDLAVRGLRDGEFDLVVTGGVSERLHPLELIAFSKLGGLASSDVHPFDARADGTLLGEGVALFALKRLEDAERDGDPILAVLRGVGGSTDGRARSLVAPDSRGQSLAMRRALEDAGGLDPASFQLIECHATGTRVGDASELAALRSVYGSAATGSIALGSVKANIGHLRSAAGAAGMLRAVLSLHHGEAAPQAAFETAAPQLELDGSAFFVPRAPHALADRGEAPVRAAVSAFSFGGSNFHVVLEAHRAHNGSRGARAPAGAAEASGSAGQASLATKSRSVRPEPLAIIGLGGMFPGADDAEGFWTLMQDRVDRTESVPASRYDINRYVDDSGTRLDKSYTRLGAFLDRLPEPGPGMRIPPSAWASLDPSHVVSLEAAAQALEDVGPSRNGWDRDRVAVALAFLPYQGRKFLADLRTHWRVFSHTLEEGLRARGLSEASIALVLREADARMTAGLPPITEDTLTGYLGSLNAGRIAALYDFHGPHFVVDAACASGLAAVHAGSKLLHHRQADVVLAGGVWVDMMPEFFIAACRFNALSSKGSFPFDARADGFIPGEGGGVVVLKRLSDAERDGDRIRAVIRGIGGSSDGRGRSVLAPSREGEGTAMRRALAHGGVSPESVAYVECHGTGTALGDVTEAHAVSDVYAQNVARAEPIAIGSVKSNIGHLNAAAGVAGLFKAALAVERGIVPPTIKVETRNPKLPDDVDVVTESRAFPASSDQDAPRRVGVSTFGVGGANFHAIVESYVPRRAHEPSGKGDNGSATSTTDETQASTPRVIAVSGADPEACLRGLEQVLEAWSRGEAPSVPGANADGATRIAITAEAPEVLRRKLGLLRTTLQRRAPTDFLEQSGIFLSDGVTPVGGVAITFPGQGGQYANMLRQLAERYPLVQETLDAADAHYLRLTGRRLTSTFFTESPGTWSPADEDLHAAVLATNVALSRLIRAHGIQPSVLMGQSAGELAALVESGALTLEDGLTAIRARTLAVLEGGPADPGAMFALTCGAERIPELLQGLTGYATLAADNGPLACIVSADAPAGEALIARCAAAGIDCTRLAVSHGYHSELIAHGVPVYREALRGLRFGTRRLEIVSTIDAQPYGGRPVEALPDFLASQFIEPVRLRAAFQQAHAMGVRVFLEAGPRWSLTQFARASLQGLPHRAIASTHPKVGELEQFQRLLAFCFVHRLGALEPVVPSPTHGVTMPPDHRMEFEDPTDAIAASAEALLFSLPISEVLGSGAVARMGNALAQRMGVTLAEGATANVHTLDALVTCIAHGAGQPSPADARIEFKESPHTMDHAARPTSEQLLEELLELTVARTGYPREMLELDLDLEADLGIDTVKQVAIFASIRERHGIERDPDVAIRELNTLRRAHAHFVSRIEALAASGAASGSLQPQRGVAPALPRTAPATVHTLPTLHPTGDGPQPDSGVVHPGLAPTWVPAGDEVSGRRSVTGPAPTVVPVAEGLPSRAMSVGFGPAPTVVPVAEGLPSRAMGVGFGPAPTVVPVAEPHPARPASGAASTMTAGAASAQPPQTGAPAMTIGEVLALLVTHTADKTGYPEEMLEPDLDLEADLGIDTVKQVAILARVREQLGIERDPNVALRELNTLRKAAQHLFERLPAASGPSTQAAPQHGFVQPMSAPTAPTAAQPSSAPLPATALSAASMQSGARLGTGGAAAAPDSGEGEIREALLTMDFDALGMDHQAVYRLADALAQRMGVATPPGLPPLRNFRALLAHLESERSARG